MNETQNFLCWSYEPRMGLHLSLSCVNSGEVSIPKFCLSPTSDEAGVVAMSSPELCVEPMLAPLEG